MLIDLFPNIVCKALIGVDESADEVEVEQQVLQISKKKADAIQHLDEFDLIVVSDTMLADPDVDRVALGKPKDEVEAAMMLHRLSGRRHRVWSSTGIYFSGQWTFFTDSSIVEFQKLSDEDLVELVLNGSWKGKAGGYDLAGDMSEFASLVDGGESTVLGIAEEAMSFITEISKEFS
jgi:septum formation protein